jgi:NTP pyrophosphatase (non-canonical NTP hydrolase)
MWAKLLTKSWKNTTQAKEAAPAVSPPPVPPSFDQLCQFIRKWGDDRKITVNSTPQAQLLKCMSELGELADATLKNDLPEIVDGVGDVIVTLVMYSATQNICLRQCLEAAYEAIKDRKGQLTPEGVFVKED